ncbi:MAG: helix-turn-helix domain-containing protein [Acutalibacteraceae bacterium]
MDIIDNLNKAVAYVEANLSDEIDIDRVARIACIDANSFIRFFGFMAGMTFNEYVRRRRLTLAAFELHDRSKKVIDIAVKYGYGGSDSFSKAFKKQHGITPTQARIVSQPLKIYPPASFCILIKGAKKMDFRIVEQKETEVFGISRRFDTSASERFESERIMWADNCDFVPSKICEGFDGVWYGVWSEGRYSIARDKNDTSGENLEKIIIPGGTYAAFTTEKGGYAGDELPRLRELIFDSWLPSSGYTQAGDFELEVFHLCTDREERRKNRYYEIWIPVKSKQSGR